MEEEFAMTQEIVEEHKQRMFHIRRFYPFFKIMETSFAQYKEGKYANLDMGYITLAVLRFFMEENSFKNKEVTYTEYAEFMKRLLIKDFLLTLEEQESQELLSFIFDKLTNEGKPFLFPYYDPISHKNLVMWVRMLDSRMENQVVYYSITAEAVEFYLDTKEFKDQSTITIEQLLLEKMIRSQNFRGGSKVIKRINGEVSRLLARKNEVLGLLSFDVFQGMKAYEEFIETGTKWFDDEQKLFEKNSSLIRYALERAQQDERRGAYQSSYCRAFEDIFTLEKEMKQAIVRHGELLQACTDLQLRADELITRSKLHALRPSFDFQRMVQSFMKQERADKLAAFVEPLLKLHIRRSFSLRMIDEMLTYRPEKEEAAEAVVHKEQGQYQYEDELEEARIVENFQIITKIFWDYLLQKQEFTLQEFYDDREYRLHDALWRNADLYTFLIHLSQKKDYRMSAALESPDTFLEGIWGDMLQREENSSYRGLNFTLEMLPDELEFGENQAVSMTNIRWRITKE